MEAPDPGVESAGSPRATMDYTVGRIYEEFERQLETWPQAVCGSAAAGDDPALPARAGARRARLVAYGRTSSRTARVDAVNKRIREIVRHALVWAWKDEECTRFTSAA